MVEHRTENSGVRGSNPFTGNMPLKSKLFYYAICSQFVLESNKAKNELTKNIELEKISVESRLSRLREFGFVSRVLQLTLHIPNNIIFNIHAKNLVKNGSEHAFFEVFVSAVFRLYTLLFFALLDLLAPRSIASRNFYD